jgi:NAD(P)-dependent dehydrogenase (short-subunit alcohol dehydrogenase family)
MAKDIEAFADGVAVITGAGSGIGAGLARRAAALGMTVVAADIDLAAAEATVRALAEAGGKGEAIRVDVSDPAELDRLAAHVHARHGDVKLLVNNAGIETIGYSWEIPSDRWERTLDVNIHGVVHGVRAFLPRMIASGKEAWVANLSSVGGFSVMPAQTAYIMTKHAVQAFSECLYTEVELAGAPVHVASIIPGMLKTSIFDAGAGAGEPPAAAAHRRKMFEMMRDYGMDLDEGCRVILEQVADGKFWVHTQPDMSREIIDARIAFFQGQEAPLLPDTVRHLVEG